MSVNIQRMEVFRTAL